MEKAVINTMEAEHTQTKIPTLKIVLWVAMASMFMLFAGLTSGYVVRQAEGNWLQFEIPTAFYYSTAILLASSLTIFLALRAAKKDQQQSLKTWLIITLGLGFAFVFSQFLGYGQLMKEGVFFTGGNVAGSFFYVITGLHVAHLICGILSLIFTTGKAILEKYNSGNLLGIQLCAIYWHFLDFLWLYLFVFLVALR